MTDKFKGWYPDYIENEARIREDDKVRSGVLGTGTFVYR